MKIIFLSREYPPDTQWGGEAIACRDMAEILANFGFDVHVICQSVNKKTAIKCVNGVFIHHTGTDARRYNTLARINYSWYAIRELLKITKSGERFIINGFYWGSDIFLFSLLKVIKIRNSPMILHAHGSLRDLIIIARKMHNYKNVIILKILLHMADFTANRSDSIIAISQSIKDELISQSHIPENRIRLLLIPRDTSKYIFKPSKLRTQLQININAKIILAVGRLEERKGSKLLCATLPRIKQYYPDAIIVFIGNDTPVSPIKGMSYKRYLLNTISKENIDSIKFIQNVTDEYLIEAYSIADVVVSASLFETSTSVPIEAMSCGKPVIVTDTGNARLMGLEGKNGIIIPGNDVGALENAILKMLGLTPEQKHNISIYNPKLIKEIFSFEHWKEELKNIANEWDT